MEIDDVDHVGLMKSNISLSRFAELSYRIPTYPITATYTGPLGLYLYFKYGRAADPKGAAKGAGMSHMDHGEHMKNEMPPEHHMDDASQVPDIEKDTAHGDHHDPTSKESDMAQPVDNGDDTSAKPQKHKMTMHDIHAHDMGGPPRPMWGTVLIGVSHCGAGCVLGDLVGEWLVFGTGAMIRGHDVWPCLLVDYGFALLFGIFFQYFSIAPMSGEYGPKTVVRAAKADFLSLTAFEVGLFGWMVAYQVGIFSYRLEMDTWCYWWLMQVGMALGFVTAVPINWWLLTKGIKEPCA
jgi:hypothetical protein